MLGGHGGNVRNIAGLVDRIKLLQQDIRETRSLQSAVRGQRYLFNLAAQTGHLDSMRDPALDLDINVTAQVALLECCRVHNPQIKVVLTSTRQIYGRPEYLPVDEKHPIRPVDVNGINKYSAEMYHVLYGQVYGLRTTILRLTNTYGPRMRIKDARQMFLGVWFRSVLQNEPFEVWDGQQKRDFNYVDDVVEAMLMSGNAHKADGFVFNLGSEQVLSLQDLAQLLVEVNGGGKFETKSFPAERKRIDIGDYFGDFSRATATLGWKPRVSLEEGLRQTLSYYRNEIQHYL
jgi:UDP-glucose 4-epimerase